MAVAQSVLETVAGRGNYVFNVNPRQVRINNVGIDSYLGGGNLRVGDSAANLDRLIYQLERLPRAKFELDTGAFYEHWVPCTLDDVRRLRTCFFNLYGLGKPNWYPPPASEPIPAPVALLADADSGGGGVLLMLDFPENIIAHAYLGVDP